MLESIPVELLIVLPLGLAAGVDLYLTLLFIGAAPTTGLWTTPLPGALGDLDPPGVVIVIGCFYLMEFAAERFPISGLVWNGFHAVIRPVSGALLALLALDGQPLWIVLLGCVLTGSLTSVTHAVRTGAAVLRWWTPERKPSTLLISAAEDAVVLGLAGAAIDAPEIAFGLGMAGTLALIPSGRSRIRAFIWALRMVVGRVFVTFGLRRWQRADELPAWVRETAERALAGAADHSIRGTRVGARGLPGASTFRTGWLVTTGVGRIFAFHGRSDRGNVDLAPMPVRDLVETDLYRRIDLETGDASASLLVGRGGPSRESLRAEFGSYT